MKLKGGKRKIVIAMALILILMSTIYPINKVKAAKTIRVPTDYQTIQTAIDAADNGDTILVANGIYYEHLTIKKSISLIGENEQATIIDGNYSTEWMIQVPTSNVTISGFTVRNSYGIKLTSNSNVNVTDNIITWNHYGISLWCSCGNTITNNIINDNIWCGIDLGQSDANIIERNEIQRTYECISLMGSCNNTIRNNYIASRSRRDPDSHVGGMGVKLYRMLVERASTDNKILNNNITDNTDCLEMAFASNNIISGNTMENSEIGIESVYSSNNNIYFNNFLNNTRQVYNDYGGYDPGYGIQFSINQWDNGTVGNYWSDYKGADVDGNGIGDTSYIINENNKDNYPLMKQYIMGAALILDIIDNNKWFTSPKIPFENISDAQKFIEEFDVNDPTPLDYGNISVGLTVQNIGNQRTENALCNATISGIAAMINLSNESLADDKKVFYDFDYWTALGVLPIEPGESRNLTMDLPIRFMSVIAGQVTIDEGNEWHDNFMFDVLFTIALLNVQFNITSPNCQVQSEATIFVVGNPHSLTAIELEAVKDRLEYAKIKAWKQALEAYIGLLSSNTKSVVFNPETIGIYRIAPTIDPGTSTVSVAVILGEGITFAGLTVILKTASEVLSTLSIPSSAIPGFAIVTFTSIEKLKPTGVISVQIELETKSATASSLIAQTQPHDNITLILTNIVEPKVFDFSFEGKPYQITIATNSTLTDFEFSDEPSAALHFNVTGTVGEDYFFKISIPSRVIDRNIKVWCNNNQIDINFTRNETHGFVYFTYAFQEENNKIVIIPEFPPLLLLPIFASLTFFTILMIKIRKRRDQSH